MTVLEIEKQTRRNCNVRAANVERNVGHATTSCERTAHQYGPRRSSVPFVR
jgi:hypothetical protein